MKRTTSIQAATIALCLAGAIEAFAQQGQAKAPGADVDKLIELMRKGVRAEKADIIGKTMDPSRREAEMDATIGTRGAIRIELAKLD